MHGGQHGVRDVGRSGNAQELSTVGDCHARGLPSATTRAPVTVARRRVAPPTILPGGTRRTDIALDLNRQIAGPISLPGSRTARVLDSSGTRPHRGAWRRLQNAESGQRVSRRECSRWRSR
jgi:hypothetical protein